VQIVGKDLELSDIEFGEQGPSQASSILAKGNANLKATSR
jgi:hypothetical protein